MSDTKRASRADPYICVLISFSFASFLELFFTTFEQALVTCKHFS